MLQDFSLILDIAAAAVTFVYLLTLLRQAFGAIELRTKGRGAEATPNLQPLVWSWS